MRVLLLCLLLAGFNSSVLAKDVKTYALSQRVFKAVGEANLLIDEKQFEQALDLVLETLTKRRLSKYERAQLWFMAGGIHYQANEIDPAVKAFKNVLDSVGKMPESLHLRTLRTLTQLNLIQEQLAQAGEFGQQLITSQEAPNSDDYSLVAQVKYRQGQYELALQHILSARQSLQLLNKQPKENVLLLHNAILYELNKKADMLEVLALLTKHYPKPTYLLYMSSIHGQLGNSKAQTALLESLHENEFLDKSSQILNLASLYLSEEVPYKAAILLESEIAAERLKATVRNYEMLSHAWRLAAEDEKALQALAMAGEVSENGDAFFRKAYIHYDLSQWDKAKDSAVLAMKKGVDFEKEGELWLLVGMSIFNLQQFDGAIEACQKASDYPKSRKLAQQWVDYIGNEKAKYEAMQIY